MRWMAASRQTRLRMARMGKYCFVFLCCCAAWWLATLVGAVLANSFDSAACYIRLTHYVPWASCGWISQGTNHLVNGPFALLILPVQLFRWPSLLTYPPIVVLAAIHVAAWLYAAGRIYHR